MSRLCISIFFSFVQGDCYGQQRAFDHFGGIIGALTGNTVGKFKCELTENAILALQWLQRFSEPYKDVTEKFLSEFLNCVDIDSSSEINKVNTDLPSVPLPVAGAENIHFEALGGGAMRRLAATANTGNVDVGIWMPNDRSSISQVSRPVSKDVNEKIGVILEVLTEPLFNSKRKNVVNLTLGNKHVEHCLFPHLYPYGIGGYSNPDPGSGNVCESNGHARMRMKCCDGLRYFKDDVLITLYTYSREFKSQISNYNNYVARPNKANKVTIAQLLDPTNENYLMNHQTIPPTINGTAPYFKKSYMDLMSVYSHEGRPADYFLTITENDRDERLNKSVPPGKRPVDVHSLAVEELLYKLRVLLDPGNNLHFFGRKVKRHFERFESQTRRGALHVHILIWLEKQLGREDPGVVSAEIPTGETVLGQKLRDLVRFHQKHDCKRNAICREKRSLCGEQICQYGYPFSV